MVWTRMLREKITCNYTSISYITIIIIIIPEDERVRENRDEKIEKYQDLAREVRRMWGVRS